MEKATAGGCRLRFPPRLAADWSFFVFSVSNGSWKCVESDGDVLLARISDVLDELVNFRWQCTCFARALALPVLLTSLMRLLASSGSASLILFWTTTASGTGPL